MWIFRIKVEWIIPEKRMTLELGNMTLVYEYKEMACLLFSPYTVFIRYNEKSFQQRKLDKLHFWSLQCLHVKFSYSTAEERKFVSYCALTYTDILVRRNYCKHQVVIPMSFEIISVINKIPSNKITTKCVAL